MRYATSMASGVIVAIRMGCRCAWLRHVIITSTMGIVVCFYIRGMRRWLSRKRDGVVNGGMSSDGIDQGGCLHIVAEGNIVVYY